MKKLITIFLVLFVVFTTVIGTAMYFQLRPEVEDAIDGKKEEETFENLDVSNYKSRVNVLLLGVDTLETKKDQLGTRSDTIMILSVDPATKTGFILSIPRDTYVKISGTTEYTKITHAHSYGGSDLAIATVKDFINIPIHHYMKLDYRAIFKTVDDLGGVEFDVPQDMYYVDKRATPPLNINLKKGLQTLNGDQAMQLIRFRKGYADQDLGRVKVQQDFIKAVLKKAYSPTSIMKIPKFVETMSEYVETDMTVPNMISLMKVGMSVSLDKIETATVPGEPSTRPGAGSVVIVDEVAFKEKLNYLMSGNYIVEGETAEEGQTSANKTKTAEEINQYNIAVLNGSGIAGAAKKAGDLLGAQNITVDSSGNASSFDNMNTVIYYKSDAQVANQIKDILKVGSIRKGTKTIIQSEPDIVIVLGKDFN